MRSVRQIVGNGYTVRSRGRYPGVIAGGNMTYLHDVVSSVVFELDAREGYSAPSWTPVTPTPADGSAASAYVFTAGYGQADVNKPVWNDADNPYFTTDGQKFFAIENGNTAFLKNLHKSTGGQSFWVAAVVRYTNAGNQGIGGNNAGLTANPGVAFRSPTADDFLAPFTNGTTSALVDTNSIFADNTDRALLFAFDTSTRAWKFFNNADTVTASGTVGALTATNDPAQRFGLFCSGLDVSTGLPNHVPANGARMYQYAMGNAFPDDTDCAAIINDLKTRFGIA